MNPRLKLVFTASILLNIVAIGAGIGMAYKCFRDYPMPDSMSAESKAFVENAFRSGREEVRPLITEVKAKRQKVEDILLSDQFSQADYDAAVDDLLVTQGKIARHKADTMKRAMAELSPEDRKKFSKEIINGLTPGRSKKGGYHHKMKDGEKHPTPPREDRNN